jgi:ribosomal RNA-processing protein 12
MNIVLHHLHWTIQREIYKVIAEVLLCLKDSNGKTREAAHQLILALSSCGDIVEFVKVIVAALGAETSHMRSAVVMALSRIVFEQGWGNEQLHSLLPGLLRTVLVLIDEGSREVTKSVVGFTRICVTAIPPEQLEPLLPELLGSLLRSQQAKSRFRAKIKIILKKLVKLFGYEALMPHVPESETRLLTHMRKLGEREKRKKQSRREGGEAEVDQFDNLVDSDEEDSDDGRTFLTGATGISRLSSREKGPDADSLKCRRMSTGGSIASAKSKLAQNAKFRLPDETDGEVVDMLGQKMEKRVHFAAAADDDEFDSDEGAMEFDDDGKLVVLANEIDEATKGPGIEDAIALNTSNKRRRLTKLEREVIKKKKSESIGGLGASYQSKKAGGDVKRKGQKYDPYAYVPLDGRAYSKKNRRSAVEQMSSVVRRKSGKRKR